MAAVGVERNGEFKIVVVGNGGGGTKFTAAILRAAKKNKQNVSVTVISAIDFTEVSPRVTECLASGEISNIYPLFKVEGAEYVVDVVKELQENAVLTEGGKTIPFDVCLLATGLNFPVFQATFETPTRESRLAFLTDIYTKIKNANTLLIAGGGAVGVEAAGDIKVRYPDKRVILTHSRDSILNTTSPSLQKMAADNLRRIGVELMLKERVKSVVDNKVTLGSGTEIVVDYYLPCFSAGPNTAFVPPDMLNEQRYVKVDPYLKSVARPNVFAIGDCSDANPVKTYPAVDEQIEPVVHNVLATLTSRPLKVYKKKFMGNLPGPIFVAMGHNHPNGFAIGPDLPGCCGTLCFVCCCFGFPCSPPGGKSVAKFKSNFNKSITPKPGKGISS